MSRELIVEAGMNAPSASEVESHSETGLSHASQVAQSQRLYCGYANFRHGYSADEVIVIPPDNRSPLFLSEENAALLECCDRFRTINQHATNFCRSVSIREQERIEKRLAELSLRTVPAPVATLLNRLRRYVHRANRIPDSKSVEAVEHRLIELAESGLLISDVEFMQRLGSGPVERQPNRITVLGVVTRNRVVGLERCLSSYLENTTRHSRHPEVVVVDDSEGEEVRDANRLTLQRVRDKYNVSILYSGLEEKTEYRRTLTEKGVPPEVVDFALLGPGRQGFSFGANRNALLLHTVGDLVLCADDDTVCRIATPPDHANELTFVSDDDPNKFWFFPERAAALLSSPTVDEDILAIHEQLLGKDLFSCVSTFFSQGGLQLGRIGPGSLRGLCSGLGRVTQTYTGIVGDSGLSSQTGYLFLTDDSRRRLLHSQAAYRSACVSREILRSATRPTITDNRLCYSATMAYDNRTLLPPFMPAYRNEDGVFSATVRTCFEHSYSGYLPRVVLHAPEENRSYSSDGLRRSVAGFRVSDFIISCIDSKGYWPGMLSGPERVADLGRHLMSIGSMNMKDFEDFLVTQLLRTRINLFKALRKQLETYGGCPEYWAKDVRECLGITRESVIDGAYAIPSDLGTGNAEEGRRLIKRYVFDFGLLLYWWPEIVKVGIQLRSEGLRLARPI